MPLSVVVTVQGIEGRDASFNTIYLADIMSSPNNIELCGVSKTGTHWH